MSERPKLTYRDAGVDIDAGDALIDRIGPAAARTRRPEVLTGLGGFGALFQVPVDRYREPVLVSGTDGVGTKLKLAIELGRHDGVGQDLVAMCVNDVLTLGAEPLFFLDYYATGRLDVEVAATVVNGIARGCEIAGCALIGGETAELPGMYQGEDYDLAGFTVGIVERSEIVDGQQVAVGDAVIAVAASGAHSNGYSLIRKVIEVSGASLDQSLDGRAMADVVMEPTRIYTDAIRAAMDTVEVRAMAHITGGGLPGNLPRVLPEGLGANLVRDSWALPPLFTWLQEAGGIEDSELFRTFNCGVGFVLVVAREDAQACIGALTGAGEQAWQLGEISAGAGVTLA
jgi:phosphoribosylformylglycinamidine cyclo-ligase